MLTYNDINKSNKAVNPMTIGDKQYAGVAERVKAFRRVFPAGRIQTEIKEDGETCTCFAVVSVPAYYLIDDPENPLEFIVLSNGTAQEKAGSDFVNKRSHIENAETSAIGRALGFMAFGLYDDIASAQEIENAKLADISKQKIDNLKVTSLTARCKKDGVPVEKLLAVCKIKSLEEMTEKKFSNVWQHWDHVVLLGGKSE